MSTRMYELISRFEGAYAIYSYNRGAGVEAQRNACDALRHAEDALMEYVDGLEKRIEAFEVTRRIRNRLSEVQTKEDNSTSVSSSFEDRLQAAYEELDNLKTIPHPVTYTEWDRLIEIEKCEGRIDRIKSLVQARLADNAGVKP